MNRPAPARSKPSQIAHNNVANCMDLYGYSLRRMCKSSDMQANC
jgi:hypothetical protein